MTEHGAPDEARPAPGDELRGRDRFPGGAAPLLGPRRRRWARHARDFVLNTISFGVITSLLLSWWGDDASRADDFTLLGVLIRGSVYALTMLAFALWQERRDRRRAEGAA